ncbi:hypothetical protein [Halalkalibacter alkaliphilus]|uniref:Uncharacterized protein n=1 Tax=Halalkalibacter alkaliphilus TaxID=2917993 RepID=A0A9X2CTM4_9BACI|nr:hypothetical protein [Halalkalibacter alkaliphilus]MCL7748006.1 hypothetical protein [Halalkalibacter alkaliphilus]
MRKQTNKLLRAVSVSGLLILAACSTEKAENNVVEEVTINQKGEVEEISEEKNSAEVTETNTNEEEVEEIKEPEVTVLSDEEAIQLVIEAESKAVEVLGESFTEGEHGLSFSDSFDVLANSLTDYYSSNSLEESIRAIYNNPESFYEYGFVFPLAAHSTAPYVVAMSNEDEIELYSLPEIYGDESFTYVYSLKIEDNSWKVDQVKNYLSPRGAEDAVRFVNNIYDPSVYVVHDADNETIDLNEIIKVIENEENYMIQVYVLNDHATATLGWYTVDPISTMVYQWDLIDDEFLEVGSYFNH